MRNQNPVFADYVEHWPGFIYSSRMLVDGVSMGFTHAVKIASYPQSWVFVTTKQSTTPVGIFKLRKVGNSSLHYEIVD